MLIVTISMSSKCELTLLKNFHNVDNNIRIRDSAALSISVFGKIFYFFNGILD